MSKSIEFQMNGRPLSAPVSTTIIEAADQSGIYIPRYCYHKKLSVVANCRMCLVEVEGMPKPVPACATPVASNMSILTRSEKTKSAQQAVMEFLLINHPLDCPICDQGGQCELQDLAMRYGRNYSNFNEPKRSVSDLDLGPLIATEMTRCIQCTRCVRFGSEVSGQMELGATGRGEQMQITTYVDQPLQSELSGNMIDVCPVGALTSKPFRFKARAWELRSLPSIAPHDCLGSHLNLHVYDQQVIRVVPRENESINEVWLSDRDRYSYLGLTNPERLTQPLIKVEGHWQPVDWETALAQAARLLKDTLNQHGARSFGGLISPSATLEEMYLFQKLCRGLGSSNIDHRLHEIDTRDQQLLPRTPQSEIAISELEQCDLMVLIGSNIQREQPLLVTRLRKMLTKGGAIISLNCVDDDFSFEVAYKIIRSPDQFMVAVASLAQHCGAEPSTVDMPIDDDPLLLEVAKRLQRAQNPVICVGAIATNHPQASNGRYWISQLKSLCKARVLYLTEGANATGAWIAGVVPHRLAGGETLPSDAVGMAAHEMIQHPLKAYLLFNVEPNLDCANPIQAKASLEQAACVIAMTGFTSPILLEQADVLLPIHMLGENAGTLINVEGRWQLFNAAIPGAGDSWFGWEILNALGKALQLETMNYSHLSMVQDEIKKVWELTSTCERSASFSEPAWVPFASKAKKEDDRLLWRIIEWPLYSIDSLVRRADALQQSGGCEVTGAYIHPNCAERLGLEPSQWVCVRQEGSISDPLPIIIHQGIPEGCLWTPAGRVETSCLGSSFGKIEIILQKMLDE